MIRLLLFILLSVPKFAAYAIFGLGIVVIYRASRILNLAHGAMAMISAYIFYSLAEGGIGKGPALVVTLLEGLGFASFIFVIAGFAVAARGSSVPAAAKVAVSAIVGGLFAIWFYRAITSDGVTNLIAVPLGILNGGGLGVAIERLFVRPLRRVSPTAQTVGTVAALGILIAMAGKIWGTGSISGPSVFPQGEIPISTSSIKYGEIGLLVVMILVAVGLFALLQFTSVGLAMRGAADNRRAAILMGIDPDLATSGAWLLGGTTAAVAGILLAGIGVLNPLVLSLQAIPAFVAVLVGGLESLPGALVGAALIGATQGLVPALQVLQRIEGMPQLLLALIALIVMATRGERLVATDVRRAEI